MLFKALPCAQDKWHRLRCHSVPKAALLLFSRNFVGWVLQLKSTDWHESYYTENLCSRHLKCGRSSEKQFCCKYGQKSSLCTDSKGIIFNNKEKEKKTLKVRGKAYRNYEERAEIRLFGFFYYFSVANIIFMMMHVCK